MTDWHVDEIPRRGPVTERSEYTQVQEYPVIYHTRPSPWRGSQWGRTIYREGSHPFNFAIWWGWRGCWGFYVYFRGKRCSWVKRVKT